MFATGSSDGFLYIFDLSASMSTPAAILEAQAAPVVVSTSSTGTGTGSGGTSSSTSEGGAAVNNGTNGSNTEGRTMKQVQQGLARRVGITGLAFNHKQRDLVAACDAWGRIHIWRLTWMLANKLSTEQGELDSLGKAGGGGSSSDGTMR